MAFGEIVARTGFSVPQATTALGALGRHGLVEHRGRPGSRDYRADELVAKAFGLLEAR